jgi:multiple sugar transport system permease protein
VLFPLGWLVTLSIRPVAEIYAFPLAFIPKAFSFEAYRQVWLSRGFSTDWLTYLLNTVWVASGVSVAAMAIGMVLGFSLSRLRGWVVPASLLFLVLVQLFEGPALVIPVYVLLARLGLYNSLWGYGMLLTVYFVPFTTLLSVSFARTIPIEIDEAAKLDGCSNGQVLRRIFLPLSRTGMVTTGLMTFLLVWGEYPFAVALLEGQNRTVSTALVDLVTGMNVYWNQMAAAAVIASLPMALVLLAAQRRIVAGLTAGAVK